VAFYFMGNTTNIIWASSCLMENLKQDLAMGRATGNYYKVISICSMYSQDVPCQILLKLVGV